MIFDYLTLKLTNRCNMKCVMCGQNYARSKWTNKDMPFEIVEECIDSMKDLKTVYLFGGEPLLYEELEKVLRLLREREIKVLITTNGLNLNKEMVDLLIENKVHDLTISIDSHKKEKFEQVRGLGTFENVFTNLELLIREKNMIGASFPYIGINSVILPENLNDMVDFYNFFIGKYPEIDRVNFEAPIMIPEEMGSLYSNLLKKEFESDGSSWEWFHGHVNSYSRENLDSIYAQIAQLLKKEKVSFLSPITKAGIESAFTDMYSIPLSRCDFPFNSATVLPNGDVTYCTDFPDIIFGNLHSESIHDILYNDKSMKFREMLKMKSMPICARCPRTFHDDRFVMNESIKKPCEV